jgi:hypothetical protein
MGLWRSRATLSAFVPAFADTGWLPGDNREFKMPKPAGQGCLRTETVEGVVAAINILSVRRLNS